MSRKRRHKPSPYGRQNYIPRLFAHIAEQQQQLAPGVHHVTVMHDDWCALLNSRGACNCNPVIRDGKPDGSDLS